MKSLATLLLLVATAVTAGEPAVSLMYLPLPAEKSSRIVTQRPEFPPDTPLEPSMTWTSPLEFARARLTRTDGTKVPYERETAHIEITGPQIKPLYITVTDFRTIRLAWTTDRILVITRDIGHIAGIEEVIDVVERTWLSQWQISYSYETR